MRAVGIKGLGYFVPEKVLSNFDLEKLVETSDEWITTRTGIKERRVAAKTEHNSTLAVNAARMALKEAGIKPGDVELIIVATISPDSNFPSVACLVQKTIGAQKAAAFDVSAACSGFLYALTTAKQFVQGGMYNNALVIASEKITSLIDWTDRSTCVLFGDGAGAAVLVPEENDGHGILAEYMHADGGFGRLLAVETEGREPLQQDNRTMPVPRIVMQGKELFKIAVNTMAGAAEMAARKADLNLDDISCVVPHQANDRIITAVANKLKIPKEKFYINIQRYGNMSAASLAVALCEAVREGRIKKGDYVLLTAFGAGLTSAANVLKW